MFLHVFACSFVNVIHFHNENPLVVPKLVGWDVLPKRVGPVVGLANKLLAGAPKPLAAVVVVPNAGFELNRLEPCK